MITPDHRTFFFNSAAGTPCSVAGTCLCAPAGWTPPPPLGWPERHVAVAEAKTSSLWVRLVGLPNMDPVVGRLEVSLPGADTYGTVCDDLFTDVEAGVVCQMLGFGRGSALSAAERRRLGLNTITSGPIFMDDVECDTADTNLFSCSRRGWALHNCGHSEDVAVECREREGRDDVGAAVLAALIVGVVGLVLCLGVIAAVIACICCCCLGSRAVSPAPPGRPLPQAPLVIGTPVTVVAQVQPQPREAEAAAAQAQHEAVCAKCGARNAPSFAYCAKCGEALEEENPMMDNNVPAD